MNTELKHYLLLSLLLLAAGTVTAQDVFINIDEVPALLSEDISLGGKGGARFLAPTEEYVITSSDGNDVIEAEGRQADGRFAWRVEAKLDESRDRTFTVQRRGTAMQAEKKKYLQPGEVVCFEIKEAEHRIVLNKIPTRDMLHPVAGKALLEFTSPIPDAKLRYSDLLGATLTRRSREGGTEALSLEIDIASLDAVKAAAASARKAYEDFERKADAAETFTDAMAAEEKKLEQANSDAQRKLAEALSVSLYSDKSNEVYVDADDILGLSSKMKLLYGVLDLFTKVGSTPFAEKLIQANKASETRRFTEAANFYRQAAEDADATEADKASCMARAETMQKCADMRTEANRALQAIQVIKAQGESVDPDKLVALFDVAILQYEKLYGMTGDEYFTERAGKLKDSRDKVGIVIRGTVLTTRVKQGIVREEPLGGVGIYGVAQDFSDYMRQGTHGDYLGSVTGSDGSFQIQVPSGAYRGLLFVPMDSKSHKYNVYQSVKAGQHTDMKIRFKR